MRHGPWPGTWKVCNTCNLEKEITEYYIHSNGKPRKQCKLCLVSRQVPKTQEQQQKHYSKYRTNNLEKCLKNTQQWRKKNLEYDAFRASTYRATKINQTPSWANLDKIKEIYLNCPKGYHVDHIIPLRGKYVRGLHIESNLQYLPAKENLSKRNYYETR